MNNSQAAALPPEVAMIQMALGGIVSKVVFTVAKLGIADHLAAGAKTPAELATALGAHPQSVYRLLRTCTGLGLFSEGEGQTFSNAVFGELLRSDHPAAMRSSFLTLAGPLFESAFGQLDHSVRTGDTAFAKIYGEPVFDHLAKHPELAKQFSETMVGFHGSEPPAVAAAYDFSALDTIVDVGGATGNLLAHVLAKHTGPKGVLFDMPHVVTGAPALLASRGLAERVSIESGNFFESVPSGGDAYVLSHIIHDWTEAQCLTILGNVRKAMKPTSRLLLVEMVLPEGNAMHPGKLLDMVMLAIPGGMERTEAEYATLLAKAGFKLSRVVPTASPASIVEALPA